MANEPVDSAKARGIVAAQSQIDKETANTRGLAQIGVGSPAIAFREHIMTVHEKKRPFKCDFCPYQGGRVSVSRAACGYSVTDAMYFYRHRSRM